MNKLFALSLIAAASLGVGTGAQARNGASPPGHPDASRSTPSLVERAAPPGRQHEHHHHANDSHCLRETGSLIKAKKGHCLPVAGRSYSRDELLRTGQTDNARALQMLDPRITAHGH